MTEYKRFDFTYIDGVKVLKDNGKVMTDNIALDLLNNLNDENEQLKSFIKKLQNSDGNILLINGFGYTNSYIRRLLE